MVPLTEVNLRNRNIYETLCFQIIDVLSTIELWYFMKRIYYKELVENYGEVFTKNVHIEVIISAGYRKCLFRLHFEHSNFNESFKDCMRLFHGHEDFYETPKYFMHFKFYS